MADDPLARTLRERRLRAFLGDGPASGSAEDGSLEALIDGAAGIFSRAISDDTRRYYGIRWRHFSAWADRSGFTSLPASTECVLLYLLEMARQDGATISTIRGRLAAINRIHLEAGYKEPGTDPSTRLFLRGLAKELDPPGRGGQADALRINDLRTTLAAMRDVNSRDVRDRAVLSLAYSGLSPGWISRLSWSDVRRQRKATVIRVRHGRGQSSDVVIRDCEAVKVVANLDAWRALAGIDPDAMFTGTLPSGGRTDRRLSTWSIGRMIASRTDILCDESLTDERERLAQAVSRLGGADPHVLRDRAVLLVGWAGAFRRPDLVLLRWSDVREEPGGLVLRLRFSKTDQMGHGRDVGIPRGKSALTCPVSALLAWRAYVAANAPQDVNFLDLPCFLPLGRGARCQYEPLDAETISRIVRDRTRAAGIDGTWGGRSLRAGFISTAADLDLPLEMIAKQSRHANLDVLMRYIRNTDPFSRNAAQRLGL